MEGSGSVDGGRRGGRAAGAEVRGGLVDDEAPVGGVGGGRGGVLLGDEADGGEGDVGERAERGAREYEHATAPPLA